MDHLSNPRSGEKHHTAQSDAGGRVHEIPPPIDGGWTRQVGGGRGGGGGGDVGGSGGMQETLFLLYFSIAGARNRRRSSDRDKVQLDVVSEVNPDQLWAEPHGEGSDSLCVK